MWALWEGSLPGWWGLSEPDFREARRDLDGAGREKLCSSVHSGKDFTREEISEWQKF